MWIKNIFRGYLGSFNELTIAFIILNLHPNLKKIFKREPKSSPGRFARN